MALQAGPQIRHGARDETPEQGPPMSYDALVWLLVGLGVGVAGSLMLLVGYVTLEHWRLGRRLRRRWGGAAAPSTVLAKPVLTKRPGPRSDTMKPVNAKPEAKALVAAKPIAAAKLAAKPAPVRPALVVAAASPAKPPSASLPETRPGAAEPAVAAKTPAKIVTDAKPEPKPEAAKAEAAAKPAPVRPALVVAAASPAKPPSSSLPETRPGAAEPAVAAKAPAKVVADIKPEPKPEATKPEPEAKPAPARPALSVVAASPPKPAVPPEPAAPAGEPTAALLAPPKRLQSVEAMFAEAFAP